MPEQDQELDKYPVGAELRRLADVLLDRTATPDSPAFRASLNGIADLPAQSPYVDLAMYFWEAADRVLSDDRAGSSLDQPPLDRIARAVRDAASSRRTTPLNELPRDMARQPTGAELLLIDLLTAQIRATVPENTGPSSRRGVTPPQTRHPRPQRRPGAPGASGRTSRP